MRDIRNRVLIICEGTTECNYFHGLKKDIDTNLNIILANAKGGGYSNILKKIKENSSPYGYVCKIVVLDFDRFHHISGEKNNFHELVK